MAYNYEYPYTDPSRYNADWLLKRMKEVDDEYAYLTTRFKEIEAEFKILSDKVDAFEQEIDSKIAIAINTYRQEIDGEIAEIKHALSMYAAAIVNLKKYIDDNDHETLWACAKMVNEAKSELENMIIALEAKIEEFDDSMYNPLSGRVERYEVVIRDLWESERYRALTNTEYESLGYDNDTYTAYNLNNRMYAVEAKDWLNDFGIRDIVRARDGVNTYEYNCDSDVLTTAIQSISADDYAAYNYDNDTYAALDLTNEAYLGL